MAGDLGQARAGAGHDDQLGPVHPAPHPLSDVAGRGGIPHRPEPDRLIIIDQPLLAQRQHIRLRRQGMQMLQLGSQPLRRSFPCLPVDAGVDPPAPGIAVHLQLSEAGILRPQVRLRGHQIRLGDLHGGFGAALGFGVEWPARLYRAAVMPTQRHHVRGWAGVRGGG